MLADSTVAEAKKRDNFKLMVSLKFFGLSYMKGWEWLKTVCQTPSGVQKREGKVQEMYFSQLYQKIQKYWKQNKEHTIL